MSGWTQPICDRCWPPFIVGMKQEYHEPTRLRYPEKERCCFCGEHTESGAYVRVNPEALRQQAAAADGPRRVFL